MIPSMESAKMFIIILITYLMALGDFTHIVVGSAEVSFLLFAGALHVNLNDLRSYRWPIGLLATFGVLIATVVIGSLAYYIFALFGWHVSFLYCLLFGALISPTDPIAVLGVLRTANASKPLKTTIVGESLFNDGTAVVVFTVLLGIAQLGETPTVGATAMLFAHEAIGGVS
jgi:CPA1 family monovalent cation:H+ antiporter